MLLISCWDEETYHIQLKKEKQEEDNRKIVVQKEIELEHHPKKNC